MHEKYPRQRPPRRQKAPLSKATTTLFEYESQHYGQGEQGSKSYKGATPSWVIWQFLELWTKEGDTVVDPFCGSGTTLDVCKDRNRKGIGFDIAPFRDDVTFADARELPLENASVDAAFFDPPYANNLTYSDHEKCIGKTTAHDGLWHEAIHGVFEELYRVVKPGGFVAAYLCDILHARKGRRAFYPLGADLAFIGRERFMIREHIAVVRKNRTLQKGNYHKAAEEQGFLLRGFNHLVIFERPKDEPPKKRRGSRKKRR